MKIKERILDDDGKIIIHQQHDFGPTIERNRMIRDLRGEDRGDMQHLGSLPMKLIFEEAKRRGVAYDDQPALEEIALSILQDRDFSAFRTNGRM